VLSIDRAYFDLTGGRERWLYKVARKHAGGAGEGGFAISMPTLFEKSGAEGAYRRFKFEIAKIAERDPLPGYTLQLEQAEGKREPTLRMRRRVVDAAKPTPKPTAVTKNSARQSAKMVTPAPATALTAAAPAATALLDASAVIRRTVVGLSSRASAGEITDATLATLRAECPGWDYQSLHQDFRNWLNADPERTPVNYQKAFIGFVRRFHEQNRHSL
jgi:plasmid replication initiation protein